MSEAVKNQSQQDLELDSFVCPHCRLLFSIRRHFDGNGVVCPGCEKLLSIPSVHDGVEAQGLSKVRFAQAGIMHKEINEAQLLKAGRWNQAESRQLEGEDKATRWMLPIGIVAILMLGGMVFVLLRGNEEKPKPRIVVAPVEADSQVKIDIAEKKFGHIDARNKEQLENQIKAFYNAETIDERIKYCRPVKDLREKMEKYYARHKASTLKARRLIKSSDLPRVIGYYYYGVEMEDYSIRDGIFVYEDGKVLFDWESQVGYSEMSWAELKKNKPSTPVLLRVKTVPISFYNDYFIDDEKWKSMRLYNELNEKDNTLYGYAKVGSAVVQKVSNFGISKGGIYTTLLVRYPEGATNPEQVEVTEILSSSWIYNPKSEKSDEK